MSAESASPCKPLTSEIHIQEDTAAFEPEARRVLQRVRSAFAAIIQALPGHPDTSQHISQTLGLHRKLGWQIAKVVYGPHLTMAATHMPGRSGITHFFDAAARHNTPPNLIGAAEQAVEAFERLIRVHASDRSSLEMMLATDRAGAAAEHIQLAHRKAAFAAGSCIWGVQARTQLTAHFLHPAADGTSFDLASLRGFIDFRRLRNNLGWVMERNKCVDDDGQSRGARSRIPLEIGPEDGSAAAGVPLLSKFCSQPLPRFQRVAGTCGFTEDELVDGPIGNRGVITFITGEVDRNVASRYRDEHNRIGEFVTEARTPCETLIFDHFVHEELFGGCTPELRVYNTLRGPDSWLERDRLPLPESLEDLGPGLAALQTPDVPRYEEMALSVCETLKWNVERFRVYRVHMRFPPIPTAVVIRYEFPEQPT